MFVFLELDRDENRFTNECQKYSLHNVIQKQSTILINHIHHTSGSQTVRSAAAQEPYKSEAFRYHIFSNHQVRTTRGE